MPVPDTRRAAKIAAIDAALQHSSVPHAFGGAVALAYYAEPRATIDIDLNLFVSADNSEAALRALAELGTDVSAAPPQIARDDQCRVFWGVTPVDLFFADLPFHDAMARAVRRVPFLDGEIPILAGEHLMVCKALFNRPKDWLDIEQMLIAVADLRVPEVMRWMDELAGSDDERTQRLRAMVADLLGA
jgi:hypothetical protein